MPHLPTPRRLLIAESGSAHRIDGSLRARRTVAPFRGVHVDADHAISLLARVRAALETQDAFAVIGMRTSAVLHHLRWLPPEWAAPGATIDLVVRQLDAHRQRAGMRLHHRLTAAVDVVLVDGVPCLSVARTLVEIARDPRVPERVVVQIIDGALRDKRTTKVELAACLARFPGERFVARARRLVELSRDGVASPQETTFRLILQGGGIAAEPSIEICDDRGLVLAAADLGIRRFLLWGEYDGYDPHTEKKVFRRDRIGDRALFRRGWHVMRFVDTDMHRPDKVVAEWHQAIADAPARIAALDPRRSPEIAEAQRLLGLIRDS